jgi:hypothetical protein
MLFETHGRLLLCTGHSPAVLTRIKLVLALFVAGIVLASSIFCNQIFPCESISIFFFFLSKGIFSFTQSGSVDAAGHSGVIAVRGEAASRGLSPLPSLA